MTQAADLVEIARGAELFHALDQTAYATIAVNGHRQTHAVRRHGFRDWLVRDFFRAFGKPPSTQALLSAIQTVEAQARFDGPMLDVWIRVAQRDEMIYLDLGDETWSAVEVGAFGWRVVSDPPVRFRRAAGMAALPVPKLGGSLQDLRAFLNLADDDQYALTVAWSLAALRPRGPYPVLGFHGEQGSAKSTTAKVLKSLIDPGTAPLRSTPHDERDLVIAATNSWLLSYDNVSRMQPWLSDALCRVATGAGFATRQLYTDADEVIFNAQRPVMLNGIEDVADRADLRDRGIWLELPAIQDNRRRDEEEFWADFNDHHPALLGALLTAESTAIARVISVKLDIKPRMADFVIWAVAGEPGLGLTPGTFLEAYHSNRQSAVEEYVADQPFATRICALVDGAPGGRFTGTAGELLERIDREVSVESRSPAWPRTPRAASGQLRRAAPALRRLGYAITFGKKRQLTIESLEKPTAERSQPYRSRVTERSDGQTGPAAGLFESVSHPKGLGRDLGDKEEQAAILAEEEQDPGAEPATNALYRLQTDPDIPLDLSPYPENGV